MMVTAGSEMSLKHQLKEKLGSHSDECEEADMLD